MEKLYRKQSNNTGEIIKQIDSFFGMMKHSVEVEDVNHRIYVTYQGYLEESSVKESINRLVGSSWSVDVHCSYPGNKIEEHALLLLQRMKEELNELLHPHQITH